MNKDSASGAAPQTSEEQDAAIQNLSEEVASLSAQLATARDLIERLEVYTAHAPICRDESGKKCDCGLHELRAEALSALASKTEEKS